MKKIVTLAMICTMTTTMVSCGSSSSTIIGYIESNEFEKAYDYYIEKVEDSKKQNEIDAQIEEKMDSAYKSLIGKYSSGDITNSDLSYIQKLASEASFYNSSGYYDFLNNIEMIDSSSSAYENGMSEFSKENYSSAIYYFQMVDAIDSTRYSDALDKINECETLLSNQKTESIQTLIKNGKYQDAFWEINSLSNADSALADSLRSELETVITTDIDNNIDSYFNAFDYEGAYDYLEEAYYDFEFESINKRLSSLEDDFVTYTLASAENDASEKNYEAASAVILQAMNSIGDDNESLNSAYNEYRSHLPIYITDMDYMSINGYLYIDENITDNVGNTYHHSLYIKGYDKEEYWTEYYINGKYATFSGVVALSPDNKSSNGSKYFEVYGDGKLIYTSPTITRSSVPEKFTIEVTGVKVLKIYYPATYGNNKIASIYDGLLTPVTE